jgi:hypothetical protein
MQPEKESKEGQMVTALITIKKMTRTISRWTQLPSGDGEYEKSYAKDDF